MILEKKTFKVCGTEQTIEHYYYHSTNKCYDGTCKTCVNKKRRDKRGRPRLPRKIRIKKVKQRECISCRVPKVINSENFYKNGSTYSLVCRDCCKNERDLLRSTTKKIQTRDKKIYDIYHKSRQTDISKGYKFNLSKEFIEKSLHSACTYCGFPSTGLDRIDNSLGHTEENCIPCCKECNISRNNSFSVEEMKIIGIAIKEIKTNRIK